MDPSRGKRCVKSAAKHEYQNRSYDVSRRTNVVIRSIVKVVASQRINRFSEESVFRTVKHARCGLRQLAAPGADVRIRSAEPQSVARWTGRFDAARCERTLQHVADPARVVSEIARILKSGGRVALVEPDWEGLLIAR